MITTPLKIENTSRAGETMKKEQCERSVSFWCTSSFSRFLCLSWWPAGLTSCLPLPLNLVGQRGNGRCMSERESEYIVVIGGGYSGDGLTGVGGFGTSTRGSVLWVELSSTHPHSSGGLVGSFISPWRAVSGGKEEVCEVVTDPRSALHSYRCAVSFPPPFHFKAQY